jgi:tRNA/rRNA methyltransferase
MAVCRLRSHAEVNRQTNITVVLVEPAAPGNIGAVARALKNTGLSRLRLVNPCATWNTVEARQLAHGSTDLLDAAELYPDLAAALADVQFAIGATHRKGRYREVDDDFVGVLQSGMDITSHSHLGLVFGREKDGLWREELDLCQRLIRIPSAVDYPSFNLAQAVLLVSYELFRMAGRARESDLKELATGHQLECLYEDIRATMELIEFKPYNDDPSNFSRVVRRVMSRTPLEQRDIKVVHMVCSQIRKFAARHGVSRTLPPADPSASAQDKPSA